MAPVKSTAKGIAAALAVWALAGCSATKHAPPSRVHDVKNGFSFVPPAGWSSGGQRGGAFMTYTGPNEGGYAVEFNVTRGPHDGSPIEQCPLQLIPGYRKMFPGWELVEDGFVEIGGKKSYFIISSRLASGAHRLQSLQYIMTAGNGTKVYAMTFTAPVESFARHRKTFEAAAMTASLD